MMKVSLHKLNHLLSHKRHYRAWFQKSDSDTKGFIQKVINTKIALYLLGLCDYCMTCVPLTTVQLSC